MEGSVRAPVKRLTRKSFQSVYLCSTAENIQTMIHYEQIYVKEVNENEIIAIVAAKETLKD